MAMVVKERPSSAAASAAHLFSPIPGCFRRPRVESDEKDKEAPSTTSTSVYATDFGACVLTWTRTLLGRTLRIQLQESSIDYTLRIRSKPFLFWGNEGEKAFEGGRILWDFGRCRFGLGTEPESGFYLAVVIGGEVGVLVGDLVKSAYGRLRLGYEKGRRTKQRLVMRKEHVRGSRFFRAVGETLVVGDRKVKILIEHFYTGRDSGLRFSFNGFRVLEIEHLVWKFRGSEQIEFEGVAVNVSWDVHSWLFSAGATKKSKDAAEASGVFVFDFEKVSGDFCEVGLKEEGRNVWERMRRSEISSLSSISSSGSSWGSSSSVMDWWSVEEKEMECGGGFSLVVYAIKS